MLDKIEDSNNKIIVLSTANPYKFTSAVLEALSGKCTGDGFKDMEELSELTGKQAPASLSELQNKPLLHETVWRKRRDGRCFAQAAVMAPIKEKIRPFGPAITFLSGQCFRWELAGGVWKGIAQDKYAEISGEYPNIQIECEAQDLPFWHEYFDSSYDYDKASASLEKDAKIADAVKKHKGLILLRQSFFETLISFIISANNNIPRHQENHKQHKHKVRKKD